MKTKKSKCPLVNVLDIVGDKWSLVIIRDLFLRKKTFTDFMKSPEKIASNILSNRLEKMNKLGLLEAVKLPEDQKSKIYYLTEKGVDMFPVIFEMMNWSQRNLDIEYGTKTLKIFKAAEKASSSNFIKKYQSSYIKFRDNLIRV
ncbi:helix-turn-helix transcriptional regulator [Flavobacteriaceae bacterium]|nr:helix-turn-helix transcriptional regulator [Flavobacteriaceae bacterium]